MMVNIMANIDDHDDDDDKQDADENHSDRDVALFVIALAQKSQQKLFHGLLSYDHGDGETS